MFFRPAFALQVLQILHCSTWRAAVAQDISSSPSVFTMADKVKEMVNDKIKAKKVMVFSKSYCPYCKKAKNALGKYLIKPEEYEVMELDLIADRDQADLIQEVMKSLTGASSVPRVFINGKFIGGGDDTEKLDRSGELKKLLAESGAIREEL